MQANMAAKKALAQQRRGERKISRIAKAKDFTKNNQIKNEQRVVLRDMDRIMGRWKGYFDKLLNGENNRLDSEDSEDSEDGMPNNGLKHNESAGTRY